MRTGLAAMLFISAVSANPVVEHELYLKLDAATGRLSIEDRILLLQAADEFCFTLQAGLEPELLAPAGTELERVEESQGSHDVRLEKFCANPDRATARFNLRYSGRLSQPQIPIDNSTIATPISSYGAYLDPATYWYPRLTEDELLRFRLQAELPLHWRGLSQGARIARSASETGYTEVWQDDSPQEGIFFIVGPFTEYLGVDDPVQAMVLLRQPDAELAQRYLDATARYVRYYSEHLGVYPYPKFALVENFWESGYGMPSFTLLGGRVLRLPFILTSSYPHEILHNWWGNGVYIDYQSGNWSESLTTYLADYLFKEHQGQGRQYRFEALQRYRNFASRGQDFPLRSFGSRHNDIAQSIGYDKGLMFFHGLRRRLGDETFITSLREFYQAFRFRRAGFDDLRQVMENRSGLDLGLEFEQWLSRTGAPQLNLEHIRTVPRADGFQLQATVRQTQAGPAYRLELPIAVQLQDIAQAWQTHVTMADKTLNLQLSLPAQPERLAIDPEFDLLRQLDWREIPPSLNVAFGAQKQLFVLPRKAPAEQRQAYAQIAEIWLASKLASGQAHATSPHEIVWDDELTQLPTGASVWLFGWNNRFRSQLVLPEPVELVNGDTLRVKDQTYHIGDNGLTLALRHPVDPQQAVVLLSFDDLQGLPSMARKLRHYGKYGYLVFSGDDAKNILKGQWPIMDSPLDQAIGTGTDKTWRAELSPTEPLLPPLPD